MKSKKKEKTKNLHLAFYFGFFIILIIAISVIFKSVDLIRNSQFDGKHRFTIALMRDSEADIISVSPLDGSIVNLHLKKISNPDSLKILSVPIDSYVKTNSDFSFSDRHLFLKMLVNKRKLQSELTSIDLLRLSVYAIGVNDEKIRRVEVSTDDLDQLSLLSSTLFVDPTISSEKVTIQITNATEVSGLGNELAKYITNMGGNVVLVNSSKDTKDKSQIIYRDDSYTVKKLIDFLDVPGQKKEMDSISDVVVIIGKDRMEFN